VLTVVLRYHGSLESRKSLHMMYVPALAERGLIKQKKHILTVQLLHSWFRNHYIVSTLVINM